MAEMDAQNLKRLKEEQEKALLQTDSDLEHWNKFRSDFVALQKRLKTLPNKTSHQVMVPFGSVAFMPGQLVHTNEILVFLGEKYFVERSAVQAIDIVSRRLKEVNKNIENLKKQREMLTPRTQFTSEMIDMASGEGEQQEIMEEYNEETEKLWRERHRELVRQAGEKEREEREEEEKQRKKDCWDVLDQLEQQESERGELESIEEGPLEQSSEQEQSNVAGGDKDVEKEGETYSHDSDETDEENSTEDEETDEEDSTEDEEDVCHSRKTITFSHTKHHDESPSRCTAPQSEEDTDAINSPADIYRLVKIGPKSILKTPSQDTGIHSHQARRKSQEEQEKKVTFGGDQVDARKTCGVKTFPSETGDMGDGFAGNVQCGNLTPKSIVKAFGDTVVERQTPTGDNSTTSSAVSTAQETTSSDRPVSRFRASRQKVDGTPTVSPAAHSQEQVEPHVSDAALQNSARPVSKFRASRMKQGGGS